jgi:hypothetical protein
VPTLPFEVASVMVAFAPIFTKPVFEHATLLLTGAILAPGKRTVTAVLRVMGRADETDFKTYHRVLSRAVWSPLEAARILLVALIDAFAPEGVLLMGIDDTIERRWGTKIAARGIYRDPVRSSKSHFVKASGLRWLSLMLLVEVSWASAVWALPFLTVLAPSERYYQQRKRRHKQLLDQARQMLRRVRRWLPERTLVVVADSSFAAVEFLAALAGLPPTPVYVVTRLRLDAGLYEPAPERKPGQRGRPRKKGEKLPKLTAVLTDPETTWERMTVSNWYGDGERDVEVVSGTCVWYHPGKPVLPIRWLLVRDVRKAGDQRTPFEPQAFLSTFQEATPLQILEWFIKRWRVEVTFEEARAHLGMETQRQWSDKAIARTTPTLLALFSMVTLMARQLIETGEVSVRQAAWYEKKQPTFSDALALVRRSMWRSLHFSTSASPVDAVIIPRSLFERFTDALCYAA